MTDRPRESDPTDRPSDAVTGKVVARKEGWSGDDRPQFYECITGTGCFSPGDDTTRGVIDPRESTDAALELLGHLVKEHQGATCEIISVKWRQGGKPQFYFELGDDIFEFFPISGSGLCYAVVHLAARVWGIQDDQQQTERSQ